MTLDDVVDIIQEQDEAKAHFYRFTLWPRMWVEHGGITLKNWNVFRLDQSVRSKIPTVPGVYTLILRPEVANHPACSFLMYVGKATSLRERFNDYLTSERRRPRRPKVHRLLNKYSAYLWFCYATVDEKELNPTEDSLIAAFLPPLNTQLPAKVAHVRGAFE